MSSSSPNLLPTSSPIYKIAADQSAVDEMRSQLNKINMKGSIVIGEGELDEADRKSVV